MNSFILSKEARRLGTDRHLRKMHAAGRLHRVLPGVYIDSSEWAALNPDERYRCFVQAASLVSDPGSQFSHDSAAALWRLPTLGPWSAIAHELTPVALGGSSRKYIQRHALGMEASTIHIDQVRVTSLARTAIDVARWTPFARAVAMIDDALRVPQRGDPRFGWDHVVPTTDVLRSLVEGQQLYRGTTRALAAIDFATGSSGSIGESYSRTQFHALGLPPPELQVPFYDDLGLIGYADFYWRELDIIGEFDGASKYGDQRRYQRSMSIDDIVRAEKAREDRMRRRAKAFVRIDWPTARDRRRLSNLLFTVGLAAAPRRGH